MRLWRAAVLAPAQTVPEAIVTTEVSSKYPLVTTGAGHGCTRHGTWKLHRTAYNALKALSPTSAKVAQSNMCASTRMRVWSHMPPTATVPKEKKNLDPEAGCQV
ncbi:hypothetical protein BaRGS_00001219 [Batillaria attramentaria]|uniref:Secreted protein n=1 Tax=Batillaria attramentaria TaxID=370345 RepID=A0ABD0M684_9CAEN